MLSGEFLLAQLFSVSCTGAIQYGHVGIKIGLGSPVVNFVIDLL